eukprot:gene23183-59448_t
MLSPGESANGAMSVVSRASFSRRTGTLLLRSYRDPNLKGTLDAY